MSSSLPWKEPVAIAGMGIITPYGRGVPVFTQALRDGRSAITSGGLAPFEAQRPVGLLPNLSIAQWLEPVMESEPMVGKRLKKVLRRKPLPVVLAALASLEAFESANLHSDSPGRSGVVVGGHGLAGAYEFELRGKFDRSPNHLPPSYSVNVLDTDHVGVLSELFSIHGAGMTVGGASASGQMALIQAANLIRLGEVDRCLVIGPLAELSPMVIQSFDAMGALGGHEWGDRPEQASRPFDTDRSGFIFSQACGAMILESISNSVSRGAPVAGYMGGAGICLDASALPSPSAQGEASVMRLALEAASLEPKDVDTINAHGTASHVGDIAELEAIASVFSTYAKSLTVQSTKGLLGHTLWAAGLVEAIAVLVQMKSDFTHPNTNLQNPIRLDIGFAGKESISGGPQVALNNSFGFGGINTSVAFVKGVERKSQ